VKLGLALGSGAARGCAHIGVINALDDIGVVPDVISGCSIGAMVGASLAAGKLERLERWMRNLNRREMLRYFDIGLSGSGIIDEDAFTRFLESEVCPADVDIADLDATFGAVATEIRRGREIWIHDGPVLDAVRASISLPGIFRPVRHGDSWLVDGGLVNPVPVSICRALGAEIVIAVNLNADIVGKHFTERQGAADVAGWRQRLSDYSGGLVAAPEDRDEAPGLFDTLASSFNIMQDRITRSRMAGDPPDIVLAPRLSHIGLMEFYRAREAIQEGRECVQRMLPEIRHQVKQD
jgi:NTE family protein